MYFLQSPIAAVKACNKPVSSTDTKADAKADAKARTQAYTKTNAVPDFKEIFFYIDCYE